MKNIGSYSYGIHTHMDTSNFGKKMRYAYGAEHTHMEFILISAAAYTTNHPGGLGMFPGLTVASGRLLYYVYTEK